MNIQILQLIEGAKKARGLTVIIDVFRAFSVETVLTRNHAAKIIPVGDVQTAFDYKAEHPDAILCGERKGIMIEGFDYGNSPAQLENVDMTGKTVIHTTSAGTQGIANAIHADEIIAGSLLSARAICEYIRRQKPEQVSLVCMGLHGKTETEEDTLCARYIKAMLDGTPLPKMAQEIEDLKRTSGAKFFDPTRQHIFPERDFHLCTQVSSTPFILRLKQDPEGGLAYMERVDIMDEPKDEMYCYTTEPTKVCPGDTITRFTKEQVILFPDQVKARIVYGQPAPAPAPADCALVLGGPPAFMESRAAAAAALYHAGLVPLLMVTGGVYWDSPFGCRTEAQILAGYLQKAGVPAEHILVEDRASATTENMRYCKALLEERFPGKTLRIAVVTSNFHRFRASVLATYNIPGHTVWSVGAEYPRDNAEEYLQDPLIRQWVTKECRCLWLAAKGGNAPDFPVA